MENRRLLAVDDDASILKQYQHIFTDAVQRADVAHHQLVDALEEGLKKKAAPVEKRQPYQLSCLQNGKEAVAAVADAIAQQEPYAVALIDMRMKPGIDGLETALEIRSLDSDLQIVFVTAYSDYSTDTIYQQISGPVLWFHKPFHSEELYQSVRNCCLSWNQAYELNLLRQDLADRVDQQAERLQSKIKSVDVLEKNALKRELRMGSMKRELRSLKAYQEMRLLLREKPLPESERLCPALTPEPLNPALEPVELLLVDDSPTVREINKVKLEEIGFKVVVAESVKEAFNIAQQHPPEVALIDFYMPGGNGDKLINLLRGDSRTMYILPLLFTNAGDELMAVEAGASYWMTKDHMLFTKMELVRDYIQKSRLFQPSQPLPDLQPENRRVLLVDDEQENIDTICSILQEDTASGVEAILYSEELSEIKGAQQNKPKSHHFELATVFQGEDAIATVREAQLMERPFAVALIDVRMPPGIDGLETARQIRQISPQIDIVIVTAYSDYSLYEIRNVLGDNFSFLVKPYNAEVLLQRVVEGCEKWGMVHEVKASHHALLNLADDMDQENTLRIEAEQQLIEANRVKDEFLASMSHELRTPLTLIIGNSERMLDSGDCGSTKCPLDDAVETIETIENAGRGQLALVNDILDMSKIQSGNFQVDESPYDLSVLLNDMAKLFSLRAADAGLGFTIDQQNRESCLLLGDGLRIAQILINLIGNA
ncbi:MAG: response regulator, partial [Gammaproteobacteria bacterium]|nr:response regulator [Gammaproteobacteria bacterium]